MSEHSGREVDEFARELTHEMRTSINQVAAMAELLESLLTATGRAQRASHGRDAFGGPAHDAAASSLNGTAP